MIKYVCNTFNSVLFLFLITLSFIFPSILFADVDLSGKLPDIKVLDVKNGLSSNQTNGLIFDKQGFLWVYTINGLNRYNGYEFDTFTTSESPDSIGGNNILSAAIDSEGRIWTGGITLNCYDPQYKRFFRFDLTEGKSIKAIITDANGHVWLGGDGFGLIEFAEDSGELINTYLQDENLFGSLIDNRIRDIARDSSGNLWIATESGIIEEFDIEERVFIHHDPGKSLKSVEGSSIRSIEVDRYDSVWATTAHGLVFFEPRTKRWKLYNSDAEDPSSLPTNDIWIVYEDMAGIIWVGTDKAGLCMFLPDDDGFYNFDSDDSPQSIPQGAVFDITEDSEGALWISIYNYGICRFSLKDRKFRHYSAGPEPSGLSFSNVLDLYEDQKGTIWIATDGGGLNRFYPETKTFRHYLHRKNDENSISSDSVISIEEGPAGILWFGTWEGGLNRLDTETGLFKHYKAEQGNVGALPANSIFSMYYDDEGFLWLSVWDKGLFRFDPVSETFADFHSEDGGAPFLIEDCYINFMNKAEDGFFYIGGHGNLEIVHPDNSVESLSLTRANEYYAMYKAEDGTLWFATSEGLVEYHDYDKSQITYGTKDGFPDDNIVSIEIDNNGRFWLGTHKGMCRFNPKTKEVIQYDDDDGLQGLEFNRYSSLKSRNGDMYFGGLNGLNIFNPMEIEDYYSTPDILITNLELFQKVATIGGDDSYLQKDISFLQELVLPYSQRDFSFEMVMMDFRTPEKNLYRYKLEGYDKNWKDVTSSQRYVRYTNLGPGKYGFLYQGLNAKGGTRTEEKRLDIQILKPWWMKPPAALGLCCIIAFIIYLIIRLRFRIVMLRQKELEKQVDEKSSQLKGALNDLEQVNNTLEKQVMERTAKLTEEITERKNTQKRLLQMVTHDPLTGLTNRAWVTDRLDELMERVHADSKFSFMMMLIDGDKFKIVNDSYGHVTGDRLLVAVAKRLQKNIPREASVSRLGGDEFIILVENISSVEESKKLAEEILESFAPAFFIDYKSINFGFSMGIVMSSPNYVNGEELLRDADIALYRAKAESRRSYRLFDVDMKKGIQEEIRIITSLKQSLEREEFMLFYQPIVDIFGGRLSGFEALIRCSNTGCMSIGPDKFIPIAEESGLINDIGLWTIKEACSRMYQWSNRYPLKENNIVMSINLSAKQLLVSELLDNVEGILKAHFIDYGSIKFEITETALMENPDQASNILSNMVDKGISIAIDDFGTGHSSLSYIHRFPFDFLKIDKSFVSGMEKNKEVFEIVKSVISMARALNVKIIAEGVETESQLGILKDFGCEYAQGYLFDKPLPPDEAESKWLRNLRKKYNIE